MSAQTADTGNAERDPGRGTRRRAPFPEGLAPTRARGDPLSDPGGGLHDRTPNEQGTPSTVGRARRSAFQGIDGMPGRDRICGAAGSVSNDGRRASGPAPKPGSSGAVPGVHRANWPRRAPSAGWKRLQMQNNGGRSTVWAAFRDEKTRYPRARIAHDSSLYHEQDCQGASFWTLAGNTRCKGRSMADRLHPIEKTEIFPIRLTDPPLSGTGPGMPERRIIARDNCFGNPGLAGGSRRPPRGAGPYPTPQHHNPAATRAHRCAAQSRCCIRASCAMPLRRASSLSP